MRWATWTATVTWMSSPPEKLLLNDGSGTFAISDALSNADRSVTIADVNGDGDLDVLASTSWASWYAVDSNDGAAGFTSAAHSTTFGMPLLMPWTWMVTAISIS